MVHVAFRLRFLSQVKHCSHATGAYALRSRAMRASTRGHSKEIRSQEGYLQMCTEQVKPTSYFYLVTKFYQ